MFLLLGLIFLTSFFFYHLYWKRRKLPPGPMPLPLLGNMHSIAFNPPGYDVYKKWAQQYGPIHTFWMGEDPVVEITDYDLIIETFQKDGETYAGREDNSTMLELTHGGKYGVVFTDGEIWRDQRRFALHVLRNFGLGKNLMQERVLVEISAMIDKLNHDIKLSQREHDVASHLDIAIGSIINNLLFGYRFAGDKEHEFYEIKKLATDQVANGFHPVTFIMKHRMNLAKYLPIAKNNYHKLKNSTQSLFKFFENQIIEHEKYADHDSEPTDYVEAFLREKAKKEEEGDNQFYTMPQLLAMLSDMWIAGQETTSNTLAWGIIYLMQDQEVQAKLHKELDTIIGNDRHITMDDKPNLHYTSAVVNEIQRISNLVPFNVPHTTTKDINIQGYRIPQGTIILPQICTILYNEKIFPNPEKFDPSRFLDNYGKWKRVNELIPFSVGKRMCLGEGLAKMELFLFTANLFNNFRFKMIPNKPPSMVRKLGGTASPEGFVCHVKKRY